MASAAPPQQQSQLPLLYNELVPLSSQQHGGYKIQRRESAPFLSDVHCVPITVDEFVTVQRFMPIVFATGEQPVPLALMGLNPGINVFIDDDGKPLDRNTYLPAYVRRYPFLLAKLRPDAEELSLCFDPTSDVIGDFDEGEALFNGDKPSEVTENLLKFCEQMENSGFRTQAFMKELADTGLLMDGEVSIQAEGSEKPFVYRGFKMVNEEKVKELKATEARKLVQNGMLALIYAHMMSLQLVREIFAKQVAQGKMPKPDAQVPDEAEIPNPS